MAASAADQIAAAPKRSRAKAPPKSCGVPDCHTAVASGARLRLTVLEPASLYPMADNGMISTCGPHKKCVGFHGYSADVAQGGKIWQQCGATAKIFYLGRPFCESCHNVYLEALVALIKPRLTSDQIDTVRAQVVKHNCKEMDPEDAEVAKAQAVFEAAKAKKAATAAAKKAALAATSEPAATPAAPAPAPKVVGKKATAAAALAAAAKAAEEEGASSEHEESEEDIPEAPKTDAFDELEKNLSKEDRAAAVVGGSPAPPMTAAATIVRDPTKPAAARAPRKAAPKASA